MILISLFYIYILLVRVSVLTTLYVLTFSVPVSIHLTPKKIRGHTYWYARESRRINGKPRIVWQKYLGKAERIVQRLLEPSSPHPKSADPLEFGVIAALLGIADRINLIGIINRHVPPHGKGPTPGEYLLWATLNRAVSATSKRAFAGWWRRTCLCRLYPDVTDTELTSQRFWDQFAVFGPERLQRIEDELSQAILATYDLDVEQVVYDTTNFFTWIDSFNDRNETAQRGRNKQKRYDLRQLNLALLVSEDYHVPLFHALYPGNQNDVSYFPKALKQLVHRAQVLGLDRKSVTLILDKGNSSHDNQQDLHASSFHFVTALTASDHSDLLAIPRDEYEPMWTKEPRLSGVRAYRTKKELWGRSYRVVLTFSESFYAKQLTSLERQMAKTKTQLQAYEAKLQRWHGPKRLPGKAPTQAGVEKQLAQIVTPQYMKALFPITVTQRDGLPTFQYRFDAAFLEQLKETRLGKTFLVTDQDAWSTVQIILAYRAQAHIEDAFKIMKDPHWVCVWPFFHWTDQKLQVHTFCCVLALTLTSLLYRTVRHAGLTLSFQEMMHQLKEIQQVLILSDILTGPKQNSVKLDLVMSQMNPIQKRLYHTLNLVTYSSP